MEDYRSNSHKSREKTTKSVISKGTKVRKKNGIRKFADAFISEDMPAIRRYIFNDIFIPYAKRFVDESFHALLYKNRGSSDRPYSYTSSYTSYNHYHDDSRSSVRSSVRKPYDFDDIVYEDRGDAEIVLDSLRERIEYCGYATLLDLYTASNRDCSYTYDRFGWSNLDDARVIPVYDGYIIRLPKAYPIEERR